MKAVDQVGMDERIVEDADLEAALELRAKRRASVAAVSKEYEEADTAARALVDAMSLAEGDVVRVGRFRIEVKTTPAAHVEFDRAEKTRPVIDYNPAED